MREGASVGSKMWKSEIRYFLKHFRRLQVSSSPEVSSTNTRIKTSRINKSFATIRVLSLLDYTLVSQRILDSILLKVQAWILIYKTVPNLLGSRLLALSLSLFLINFRNTVLFGMGLTAKLTGGLTEALIELFET